MGLIPDSGGGQDNTIINAERLLYNPLNGTHVEFSGGRVYFDIIYNNTGTQEIEVSLTINNEFLDESGTQVVPAVNAYTFHLPPTTGFEEISFNTPIQDETFEAGSRYSMYFRHADGNQNNLEYRLQNLRFSFDGQNYIRDSVLHISFDNSVNQPIVDDGTLVTNNSDFS